MRFFIGHRLIGGFFVGASFRPRFHPEIPHPTPLLSWASMFVIGAVAVWVWFLFHGVTP
jgi:hypothetical protein